MIMFEPLRREGDKCFKERCCPFFSAVGCYTAYSSSRKSVERSDGFSESGGIGRYNERETLSPCDPIAERGVLCS